MGEKTTHFGAREVPEGEKAGMVRNLFSDVANLDLINLDAAREALEDQATAASGQAVFNSDPCLSVEQKGGP